MRENHIRILCSVLKVELVYESEDGSMMPFFDAVDESILMHSADLRMQLRNGISGQTFPFMFRADEDCWFASLHADSGILYMGPMCHQRLTAAQRRRMYHTYGINEQDIPQLPVFSLPEIRNMVLLTNSMLENVSLENEELLQLNRIIKEDERTVRQEQIKIVLSEEAQNDDDAYRHGFGDEKRLMQAIREGNAAEAVRLAEKMDADSGRLSEDFVRHRRNLAIVGIALCARAAIDGGIAPESAYRISGYYIMKCDTAQDPAFMLHYRNRAIEELTGRVAEIRTKSTGSMYVARATDYIRKHYREDIRVEKIADTLEISKGYLSHLYHRETGTTLQDCITETRVRRATELLLYSRQTLSEIAAYVNFPNQSYFTKMFRKIMGMTPLVYRRQNAVREIALPEPE